LKKKRPRLPDSESLEALRQDDHDTDGQSEDRSAAPLLAPRRAFDKEASASLGWPLWLAWVFGLLGVLVAAATWALMGVAAFQPLSISRSLLVAVWLGPVIGAGICLPGMICALLATSRARAAGASVAAPVTLVGLATVVLIAGLLFGGLVSYPHGQLGTFGQAIQAHCARFAQSLQSYGNPPDVSKIQQDPVGLVITLQNDQAALVDDQTALNALTTPDPAYLPLLDDCRSVVVKDGQVTSSLLSELIALPPNVSAAEKTITRYETDTTPMLKQIEQLGAALKQQVFAPFLPG
jgi:hypothetical protein